MKSGSLEAQGNITIPDNGNIGSASDTDAITVNSSGDIGINTSPLKKTTCLHKRYHYWRNTGYTRGWKWWVWSWNFISIKNY